MLLIDVIDAKVAIDLIREAGIRLPDQVNEMTTQAKGRKVNLVFEGHILSGIDPPPSLLGPYCSPI